MFVYLNIDIIKISGDNMKSNKGFTLVELLAVIAVLVIIMLIASRSINGVSKKTQQKIRDEARANLKETALSYVLGKKILPKCSPELSKTLDSGNTSVSDNECLIKITVKTLKDDKIFEDNRNMCKDNDLVIVYRYNDGNINEYRVALDNNVCRS